MWLFLICFMFWVKQFSVMMLRWEQKQNKIKKKKKTTNTFDCRCFSVVASRALSVFPSPLDTLQVVADNSQGKLRHQACTLLDSILNLLFTPGWHFFTLHVAVLTPISNLSYKIKVCDFFFFWHSQGCFWTATAVCVFPSDWFRSLEQNVF